MVNLADCEQKPPVRRLDMCHWGANRNPLVRYRIGPIDPPNRGHEKSPISNFKQNFAAMTDGEYCVKYNASHLYKTHLFMCEHNRNNVTSRKTHDFSLFITLCVKNAPRHQKRVEQEKGHICKTPSLPMHQTNFPACKHYANPRTIKMHYN